MKKIVSAFSFVILFILAICVGVLAEGQPVTAFISGGNSDRVHLRTKPSKEADSLGLYFSGTPVICTGTLDREWVPVRVGTEQGYMMSAFLSDKLADIYPFDDMKTGIVHNNSWVNLRSGPSTQRKILRQLQEGDQIIILGETNTHWYYVCCNGLAGYVKAEYVEQAAQPLQHQQITTNIIDVIRCESTFWHTGAKKYMYISQVGNQCFDGLSVTFPRFTVADIDRDLNDEIVLVQTVGGDEYYGYLVLKSVDGVVRGYEVFYRAMLSLKADGTFSFSSGAADNGFGYLKPEGDSIHLVELAESVSSNDGVVYFLNGQTESENLFREAVKVQDQKPDIVWYDLTNENLSALINAVMLQ